ncbi:MAG TPA: hypothetical protein VKB38_01125 [Terracidiphilus sp.]|nr:hypothetical protein [Terracidiphilus sp.]
MESSLRPLTLGEILDRTAQLYRTNFVLFAGIFAVTNGIVLAMALLVEGLSSDYRAAIQSGMRFHPGVALLSAAIIGLIGMVLYGASIAAITRAVAWIQLGEPVTIRSAYASTLRRLGRYIWLMVLALLILLGIALVAAIGLGVVMAIGLAAVAVVLQGSRQAGLIAGVTIGLLFDVGIFAVMAWFGARYALGISACVVEGLKARKALRRSVELSKESRGRIFLLFLLVGVIQAGLLLLTQSAFYTYMFRHHMQLPLGLNILSQITSVATNILVGPILATGLTLFYFDQRVRKEGYDIEWMMQAAGLVLPHGVETPETILPIETPPHAAPAGGALEIAALDQTAAPEAGAQEESA